MRGGRGREGNMRGGGSERMCKDGNEKRESNG